MKQLELNLNKRLLIVDPRMDYLHCKIINNRENTETIAIDFYENNDFFKMIPIETKGVLKPICKGSEFTEEIAKGLVDQKQVFDTPAIFFFKNYKNKFSDCMTALESFISAIENAGYWWGENPLQLSEPTKDLSFYDGTEQYKQVLKAWEQAQSRTFNLNKTLIFEIL